MSGTRIQREEVPTATWRSRSTTGALVGTVAAISLLMILMPTATAASAGSVASTIKVTAPYPGAAGYASTSLSQSGCGGAKVVKHPSFSAATGKGVLALSSHSALCSPVFGDYGSAGASLEITVPIHLPSGTHRIVANWNIAASLRTTLGSYGCTLNTTGFYSSCYAYADATLSAYPYLVDDTNGTYYFPTTYWQGLSADSYVSAFCYSGTCGVNFTGNDAMNVLSMLSWSIHASGLVSTHQYSLLFYLSGSVECYDSDYSATMTGGALTAAISLAGPSHGATLTSVVIH
jgi:hypothetical protein